MKQGGPGWEPYAAGDRIRRSSSDAEDGFEILTPVVQPGWRTPTPATASGVPPPGTPVLFEGDFYEVVEHLAPESGHRHHRYRLRAWDPRQPLRAPVEYSREQCELLSQELRRREAAGRLGRLLRLLQPIVSLLPGALQKDLERRYHYPAIRGTLLGAVALGVWGSVSWALHLAAPLGTPPDFAAPRALAVYLIVESAVRAISAVKVGEPMGSAPVVLVTWIVQVTRSVFVGDSAPRSTSSSRLPEARPDRLRTLPLADGEDLGRGVAPFEVRSSMAKDHWTLGRTAVRFGEHLYLPVEGAHDHQTDTFVYRLEPVQEGQFPAKVLEYTPDENRRLLAERVRRDRKTWIDTLALLWGNLDRERQRRLAEIYGFDCRRFTVLSILVNGGLALVLIIVAGGHLGDTARFLDLLLLIGGCYFLVESALRALRLRRGELSGGLLGRLLQPTVERLTTF